MSAESCQLWPRRLPVARQHPDHEDGCARANEERSRRRAEAGTEQARHGEHENDSDDELDHPMDCKGDHLDEAERKAREECHQEMADREPPSNDSHIATQPEKEWREKKDSYGGEIEKAMETRVQKVHEPIIARAVPFRFSVLRLRGIEAPFVEKDRVKNPAEPMHHGSDRSASPHARCEISQERIQWIALLRAVCAACTSMARSSGELVLMMWPCRQPAMEPIDRASSSGNFRTVEGFLARALARPSTPVGRPQRARMKEPDTGLQQPNPVAPPV